MYFTYLKDKKCRLVDSALKIAGVDNHAIIRNSCCTKNLLIPYQTDKHIRKTKLQPLWVNRNCSNLSITVTRQLVASNIQMTLYKSIWQFFARIVTTYFTYLKDKKSKLVDSALKIAGVDNLAIFLWNSGYNKNLLIPHQTDKQFR
jgi:hypothetical protein